MLLVGHLGDAQRWGLPTQIPLQRSLPGIKLESDVKEENKLQQDEKQEFEAKEREQMIELRRASHLGSVVLSLID